MNHGFMNSEFQEPYQSTRIQATRSLQYLQWRGFHAVEPSIPANCTNFSYMLHDVGHYEREQGIHSEVRACQRNSRIFTVIQPRLEWRPRAVRYSQVESLVAANDLGLADTRIFVTPCHEVKRAQKDRQC